MRFISTKDSRTSLIEIQRELSGDFLPAAKYELIDRLRQEGVPSGLLSVLYRLPARRYETVRDVSRTLSAIDTPASPVEEPQLAFPPAVEGAERSINLKGIETSLEKMSA